MNGFGTLSENVFGDFAALYGWKFNRRFILERETEENGSCWVRKFLDIAWEKNQKRIRFTSGFFPFILERETEGNGSRCVRKFLDIAWEKNQKRIRFTSGFF